MRRHTENQNPDPVCDRKCVICGKEGSDRAHYRHKGSLPKKHRWDKDFWRYLCRTHHIEEGTIGEVAFAHKYGMVAQLYISGYPPHKINRWRKERGLEEIKGVMELGGVYRLISNIEPVEA
jgi:hypothetical protein